MVIISKKEYARAIKIWAMQKKHPRTRFVVKDFTSTGKLTRKGLEKVRRIRRVRRKVRK